MQAHCTNSYKSYFWKALKNTSNDEKTRNTPSNDVIYVASAERLNEAMTVENVILNEVETEDRVHGFCGKILFYMSFYEEKMCWMHTKRGRQGYSSIRGIGRKSCVGEANAQS